MSNETLPVLEGDYGDFTIQTEGVHAATPIRTSWATYSILLSEDAFREPDLVEAFSRVLERVISEVIGEENSENRYR